jgi:acetyltransferase
LVAVDTETPEPEIVGVVRIVADADHESAEYAVMVRSDLKSQGLGWQLMKRILGYAESRGIGTVWGHVLRENTTMIEMARELGFAIQPVPDDMTIVKVVAVFDKSQASAAE